MQLEWNAQQKALFDRYASFGREIVAPRAEALSAANQFDSESWKELNALGFLQLVLPEIYGGQGDNWWDFTAALEGLASTCGDGGFLLTLISQAGFIHGLNHQGDLSSGAVGHIPFVPIEPPAIPVGHCLCFQSCQVGAGMGFSNCGSG